MQNKDLKKELKKNFLNPPDKYGELPCYWWEAGKINKDELKSQLKDMRDKGARGIVMFNLYYPGDRLSSDPAYLTKEWWELVQFVVKEEKKLGMEFWSSSWEGRGYWQDILREEVKNNPGLGGFRLVLHEMFKFSNFIVTNYYCFFKLNVT